MVRAAECILWQKRKHSRFVYIVNHYKRKKTAVVRERLQSAKQTLGFKMLLYYTNKTFPTEEMEASITILRKSAKTVIFDPVLTKKCNMRSIFQCF